MIERLAMAGARQNRDTGKRCQLTLLAQYQDRQFLTLLARVASDLVERAGIDVQRHSVVADPLRIDLLRCRPVAYAGFLTDRHIDQVQIDAGKLFDLTDQSLQYGVAARHCVSVKNSTRSSGCHVNFSVAG